MHEFHNLALWITYLKRFAFFFVLIVIYTTISKAQVLFDDNFENGRLDTAVVDSSSYSLWPITNLHFRITNALNQSLSFKIFDSTGYQLRPYHNMVYRYEGDSSWNFFDTAYKAQNVDYYHFFNQTSFTKDTVYIAYWYPYTYSDLQQYLSGISGNQHLINSGIKALTYQGRNIYGYQITDTAYSECYKANVVITCRQHPVENINGYFIEGLTDYLLYSTDSTAEFLRRNFHYYIYPMLNPDGVYMGSGQNALGQGLNREWEDSLRLGGTPEIDSIRPVIWQETGQKVNWSIDIHSNAGSNIPYYWWGYTNSSSVPQWQIAKALQYVQAVAGADFSSPINLSSYQNYIQGNGVSNIKTAANWFRKSFGAIAFTFEPTSEPMGLSGNNDYTIDHLKTAGSSLAKGFYSVFDTVQAMGGTINIVNNIFIPVVTGGHPPYSYTWSGPIRGNSDTLPNLLPGLYNLTVIDSLGCMWQKNINHFASKINFPQLSDTDIIVYPNPSCGLIRIEFKHIIDQATLEVYDISGRRIQKEEILNKGVLSLRLSSILPGIYFLKIVTKDLTWNKKILVIH
jgi:hypothetical protein